MLSPFRSVCRLSVTLVHPTQPVEIFGNFSLAFGTLAIHGILYGDCPRGTPLSGGGRLNARGVTKYSDFSPLECCICQTVQDRR